MLGLFWLRLCARLEDLLTLRGCYVKTRIEFLFNDRMKKFYDVRCMGEFFENQTTSIGKVEMYDRLNPDSISVWVWLDRVPKVDGDNYLKVCWLHPFESRPATLRLVFRA